MFMAVTDWNWTVRTSHLGNSDYFVKDYQKKTKRFEHLQDKNNNVKLKGSL